MSLLRQANAVFEVLDKNCTVTPGGGPILLTEDAVSSSAVSAAYCELACTESCERVSPLRAVGDDITVSAQNFLQRKFSTATLELDNLRLQPATKVPCVPLETIPNTTDKLSLDRLKEFFLQQILVPAFLLDSHNNSSSAAA